ncbi:MAG: glycosyltransferase [Acidimicrobiia bacterium]|nr:glycosyltransferase [Acidimicrobiia bacterium]
MRVLIVTNMLPTPATPTEGVFIGEQIDSLRNRGLDVDVVHVERTQQGMRSYTALPRHLRRAVANGAPEVVHATYGGLLAYLTERATPSIPFVVSFCGSDLQGEPTSPPLPRATAQVGVLASRRVARRADEIVVKTSSLAMHLPTTVPQERVHVIPNGVSTERFRPLDREDCRARLGWSGPGPHVMLAGQPRPIKRPELARRAVELLRTDLEGAELHIPDGVSRDDMPRWLNASDAVVLTSRHEGSPTSSRRRWRVELRSSRCPSATCPSGSGTCRTVGSSARRRPRSPGACDR